MLKQRINWDGTKQTYDEEWRKEPAKDAKDFSKIIDYGKVGPEQEFFPIDKPLGSPMMAEEIALEVSGPSAELLRDAGFQKVSREGSKTFVTLSGKYPLEKVTDKDRQNALKSEGRYDFSDPRIRTKALEITKNEEREQEKIWALTEYVHSHIEYLLSKNDLDVAEVLEMKKGDCSEKSLLLTVMLRSIGIPARAVYGLVYKGDKERGFGAHAWVEIGIASGVWLPIDPTSGGLINIHYFKLANGYEAIDKLELKLLNLKKRNR